MEWKIGEIKQINGEWYQCLKSPDGGCKHCDMNFEGKCPIPIKECTESGRSDKSYVIFKKLEKVGEPIEFARGLYFQRYQLADSTAFYEGNTRLFFNAPTKTFVYIEIKTKEDMEEKNNAKHSNSEKIGKNLKEFDLEAAKSGKPVCTRDGRKARIICFDRISGDDYYKIVACVTAFDEDFEEVLFYGIDGYIVDSQNPKDEDLMMLPEKKEGWINVYKERCYESKEEAIRHIAPGTHYIDTIRVEWEDKE
ncbi:hypothetical protein H6B14_04625 [Phocaeicola coprophilus]|nr:hypothetical protein [Phocaeicola coprophilus]